MHYKNGREAKEGDPVITKDQYSGKMKAGVIHSLLGVSDTCNGQLAHPVPGGVFNSCINVKDCLHAEDAWNAATATVTEAPTQGSCDNPACACHEAKA